MKIEGDKIIIKEIPYQVNKATLLEKIAQLVRDKKIEGIRDLRDESDRDGIRIVIEIKRDGNGVPLPLPMQPIKNMHIEGFLPVIINITPVTNLPLLLGLADDAAPDMEQTSPPSKAREPEQIISLN